MVFDMSSIQWKVEFIVWSGSCGKKAEQRKDLWELFARRDVGDKRATFWGADSSGSERDAELDEGTTKRARASESTTLHGIASRSQSAPSRSTVRLANPASLRLAATAYATSVHTCTGSMPGSMSPLDTIFLVVGTVKQGQLWSTRPSQVRRSPWVARVPFSSSYHVRITQIDHQQNIHAQHHNNCHCWLIDKLDMWNELGINIFAKSVMEMMGESDFLVSSTGLQKSLGIVPGGKKGKDMWQIRQPSWKWLFLIGRWRIQGK